MRSLYSPITESYDEAYASRTHSFREIGAMAVCVSDGERIQHARELHNNYSEWAIANPLVLSRGRLSSIIKLKYETIKALSRAKYTLADPYMCIQHQADT